MSLVLIHALAKALYELRMSLFGKKENSVIPLPPYGTYQFSFVVTSPLDPHLVELLDEFDAYQLGFVAKMPLDPHLAALLDELQRREKIAVKEVCALKSRARRS